MTIQLVDNSAVYTFANGTDILTCAHLRRQEILVARASDHTCIYLTGAPACELSTILARFAEIIASGGFVRVDAQVVPVPTEGFQRAAYRLICDEYLNPATLTAAAAMIHTAAPQTTAPSACTSSPLPRDMTADFYAMWATQPDAFPTMESLGIPDPARAG